MSLDVSATVTVVGTSLSIARASPLVFLPHGRIARAKPPAAQPQPPVIWMSMYKTRRLLSVDLRWADSQQRGPPSGSTQNQRWRWASNHEIVDELVRPLTVFVTIHSRESY